MLVENAPERPPCDGSDPTYATLAAGVTGVLIIAFIPCILLTLWLVFCLVILIGRSDDGAAKIIRAAAVPLRRARRRRR